MSCAESIRKSREGQLGALALEEGNLPEALERYQKALKLFQHLNEPDMEGAVQHQIGMVFQEKRQWDQAEHHFRESARLSEKHGDEASAARTFNHLAHISEQTGKLELAETWYRKAIYGGRQTGDLVSTYKAMTNIANLLQAQPDRLTEAREIMEEVLTFTNTRDPGALEIWKTYEVLD